jgi:hypothetical protein
MLEDACLLGDASLLANLFDASNVTTSLRSGIGEAHPLGRRVGDRRGVLGGSAWPSAVISLTSTVERCAADLIAAEARVASECYRFGSAAGAELGQNVADTVADALFCEYEAAGDDSVV